MAKSKTNKKGTKQSLGDGASDIFNQDLSVKPGHFPELDDENYPAKLKEELQKDKQQRETEMAFPHKDSPSKYERDSKLFLLQNINRPNGKLTLKQVMQEASPEQLSGDKKQLKDLLAKKRDEGLYLTGSWLPYQWTAHHLIPHELLSEKELGETGYQLLQESGYDINNGHNGIITPACSWAVPMHCVIQHKGNHPAYSEFVLNELVGVKKTLKTLASQVQAQKDNPPDHKTVTADVLDRLTKLEDRLWQRVLDLSHKVVPEALRGNQSQHPHVSFARGKSVFPFGVLS
ncbi:AHH domain-containing protein [Archangium sp.]|uniref:AHH domain-containing protein n=1 Tax=Archangium sp. TaxID=1872627 RepID=UPI002D4C348D|nr:AHH domain-containing protein [Archangium sp.]HYO54398.1 AHH domain-containing protein [Archangium sp.]